MRIKMHEIFYKDKWCIIKSIWFTKENDGKVDHLSFDYYNENEKEFVTLFERDLTSYKIRELK